MSALGCSLTEGLVVRVLSESARAAVNKHYRLGRFDQNLLSPSSGGWKVQGPAWSGSGEGPLPGFQMTTSLLYPHTAEREGGRERERGRKIKRQSREGRGREGEREAEESKGASLWSFIV